MYVYSISLPIDFLNSITLIQPHYVRSLDSKLTILFFNYVAASISSQVLDIDDGFISQVAALHNTHSESMAKN